MVSAVFSGKIEGKNVPQLVREKFEKGYPSIHKVEWKEKNGHFKAVFESGGSKISVFFEPSGKILKQETKVKAGDLPGSVQKSIASAYPDLPIKKAKKIEKNGEIQYEATLKRNRKDKIKVTCEASGKIIRENETRKSGSKPVDEDD